MEKAKSGAEAHIYTRVSTSMQVDGFSLSALTMADVIKMEQFFGMSHLAMFWRLVRSLGYDDKLYKPNVADRQKYTYGHYLKQVEELSKRDIVSEGKIDELLLDAFRDDIVYGIDAE